MTRRRKENNNYNNKSLILLGKVSYVDHMKSFSSVKDGIFRDIIYHVKHSQVSFLDSLFPSPFSKGWIPSNLLAPILLVAFCAHVDHLNSFYYDDPFLNVCHINISSYTHFAPCLPYFVMHLSQHSYLYYSHFFLYYPFKAQNLAPQNI